MKSFERLLLYMTVILVIIAFGFIMKGCYYQKCSEGMKPKPKSAITGAAKSDAICEQTPGTDSISLR